MKRIVLVDPQPLSRRGLAQIICDQPDLQVADQFSSGQAGLDYATAHPPDLVMAEVRTPDVNGLDLTQHLIAVLPRARVLLYSQRQEAVCAERSLRAGARGYLVKSEEGPVVLQAVRHVLAGGYYVSLCLLDELFCAIAASLNPLIPSPADVLSTRELELFEYMGQGLSTNEIAEHMQVSIKTVESYRKRAKEKLNLKSTTALLRMAVRWLDKDQICYSWSGCPEAV